MKDKPAKESLAQKALSKTSLGKAKPKRVKRTRRGRAS